MMKTKESAAADRALRNARMEAEEELYSAWLAYYDMNLYPDMTEKEEEAIYTRQWTAYDRAYELLGPEWTQNTIDNARKDAGE